jgi:hypothetical protein
VKKEPFFNQASANLIETPNDTIFLWASIEARHPSGDIDRATPRKDPDAAPVSLDGPWDLDFETAVSGL